jgi:hypothetical protein
LVWRWSSAYGVGATALPSGGVDRHHRTVVLYLLTPLVLPTLPRNSHHETLPTPKQLGHDRRLTAMQTMLRPIAATVARTLVLVGIAALLILVLLPAAIAAQAATAS